MSGQVLMGPATGGSQGGHATSSRTLPPRWRKALFTAHVSMAAGLIGADLSLLALAVSGWRGSDAASVYPAMSLLSRWVVAPLAVAALITGVLQATLSPYGLLRYWWVTIKLAITLVLTGLVLFLVAPGLGEAADSALGGASEALTDARRAVYVVVFSLAVAAIALMAGLAVAKPRWRLRSGAAR
jgi:uncharacterized membrane protein